MRRIHHVSLALALFAIIAFVIGTGGYSSMETERGVNLDVVNDEKANLGVSDENTVKTNGTVLLILTNRFGAELTITVQATESNDYLNISIINIPFKLDRGASAPVTAMVHCSKAVNGVPVVVHITASNSDVRISMNRTVRVSCTPKQEATSDNAVSENTSDDSSDSISSVDGESVSRVTIKRGNDENTTVQIVTQTTTTSRSASTTKTLSQSPATTTTPTKLPSKTATTPESPPATITTSPKPSATPPTSPAATAPSDTSPSTDTSPADASTPIPTTVPTQAPTAETPTTTAPTKPTTRTPTATSTTQTRTPTATTEPTATSVPTNTTPSTDTPPTDSVTPPGTNSSQIARNATITRVIDGDTFELRFSNGETDTIQLIGVDTPEAVTENETPPEYGIPNSSRGRDWLLRWNENAQMFIENNITDRQVQVVTDPVSETRDDAGHLLAYVYYGADRNTSLGQTLLERGLARQKDNTDYMVKELYRQLEQNARTANRGLWTFETKMTISTYEGNITHERAESTTQSVSTISPISSSEHSTTATPIPENTTTTTTNRTLR